MLRIPAVGSPPPSAVDTGQRPEQNRNSMSTDLPCGSECAMSSSDVADGLSRLNDLVVTDPR